MLVRKRTLLVIQLLVIQLLPTQLAVLFAAAVFLPATLPSANAQARPALANFQGEWDWAIYAKSRDELPPAYRNEKL